MMDCKASTELLSMDGSNGSRTTAALGVKQSMFRFFFRMLSLLALAGAIMAATLDAIQSVAASQPVLTPLAVAWTDASPDTIAIVADTIMNRLHPKLWDPIALWILSQPASIVMLALALLFWMIGYKRRPFAGRFTA
jgi:hypothetical protein